MHALYISMHDPAQPAFIQQNGLSDTSTSKNSHGSKKYQLPRLIFLTPMTGFAVKYNHLMQKVVLTILSCIYTHTYADFQYNTFISVECRQNIKNIFGANVCTIVSRSRLRLLFTIQIDYIIYDFRGNQWADVGLICNKIPYHCRTYRQHCSIYDAHPHRQAVRFYIVSRTRIY